EAVRSAAQEDLDQHFRAAARRQRRAHQQRRRRHADADGGEPRPAQEDASRRVEDHAAHRTCISGLASRRPATRTATDTLPEVVTRPAAPGAAADSVPPKTTRLIAAAAEVGLSGSPPPSRIRLRTSTAVPATLPAVRSSAKFIR